MKDHYKVLWISALSKLIFTILNYLLRSDDLLAHCEAAASATPSVAPSELGPEGPYSVGPPAPPDYPGTPAISGL